MKFLILLTILAFSQCLVNPVTPNNATLLTVHLIPHTHDDIGWLKTVDQYYIDSQRQITIQGVQYILDSVMPELVNDPTKRFIYVEIGFFLRWWREQDATMKQTVQNLVSNGQLEFINGGYCMNDEAAVYYEDSIDQMTFGHQFLLQNFNFIPTIGWHIDPFGHASAQAALMAQMGFQAFFFSRIDYQDHAIRDANKALEMVWIPNTSQGIENAIFTSINYNGYGCPAGFDFDVISSDDPINDDHLLEGYNVNAKADALAAYFRSMSTSFLSADLLQTAGSDFEYMNANQNYKNWDKLLAYIRANPDYYNMNILYDTPSGYIQAINSQNLTYPNKTDDFFPYADEANAYWTGYFTSRVSVKGYVRQGGRFLQAARRLASQALWEKTSNFVQNNFTQVNQALYALEEAMSTLQHHDAVTGTEKQAVAEDYKFQLSNGISAAQQGFLFPYLQERVAADLNLTNVQFSTCNLNTSAVYCDVTNNALTQGQSVLLTIYNSGTTRFSNIRVKVTNYNVQVRNAQNNILLSTDVICSNSTDATDCDLFFADTFDSYAIAYYYIVPGNTSNQVVGQPLSIGNTYPISPKQSITPSALNNFALKYCTNLTNCYNTAFSLNYNYYEGFQVTGEQDSGAYIFRPSQRTINGSLSYSAPASATVYKGTNLLQIQIVGPNTIANIRIYNDFTDGVEVSTFINSIPISDGQGKEIVMIVQVPSINNGDIFYTDSMGMELQQRKINYRPTWNLQVNQPVSGNYYPVQSTIKIQDPTSEESLAIIPDRAEGGSSINPGEIELMLHRRLLVDDGRGVGEALNETDPDGQGMRQWMTHTLLFNMPGFIETSHRQVQLNRDVDNLVILAPATVQNMLIEGEKATNSGWSDIGPMIKLLTRPMSTTQYLLRFQNMDEVNTNTVNNTVFHNSAWGTGTVTEMSLTVNQAKADMIKARMNWNGLNLNDPSYANTDYLNGDSFTLRPLEIRSFVVDVSASSSKEEDVVEL